MLDYFLNQDKNQEVNLSKDESTKINELADSRYRTWEWNYAYGPAYQFKKHLEIRGNSIEFMLSVKNGIIQECTIEGSDLFARFAGKLTGCRHMPEDISSVFNTEILLNDDELFVFF
jgi:lipoate-protein ligase A